MKATLKLIGSILLLALPLSVLAQPAPPPTEVDKLGDHVYRVFLGAYNSLVVVGDDGVLITDPGFAVPSS